ncbi:organic cation transporter protein [Rhipicephalus sanguineus]|uniref:organic cation transporter protein n=1 Tax=Rhipicephalus sanguineus TaxID=34632 RepID=UPI0018959DFF|nr:organic cation transporter protein [Rhipicephalus sanguineus]
MESILDPVGPWHVPVLLFGTLRGMPASLFVMSLTFMAPQSQDHWCEKPAHLRNWTTQQWRNLALPLETSEAGITAPSRCYMHGWDELSRLVSLPFLTSDDAQTFNQTTPHVASVPCSSWDFDDSFHERTVSSEWNVVCEDLWMLDMSQSILMFGFMVGNFVFSHMSDWCGRRPAIFTTTLLSLASGVATAFSSSFAFFNGFRFLASIGHGGLTNIAYAIAIECVAPGKRAMVSMVQETGWVFGLMLLPGIAYLVTNWVHIQLLISVPLVVMLITAFYLDESPRWLFIAERSDEAEKLLLKIAERNNIKVKDISKIVLQTKEKVELERKKRKSSIVDLFRKRKIAVITLATYVQFAVVVLVYYDLIYKITDFGGNPFINFFLVSLLELPVMLVNVLLINYVPRRVIYYLLYIPAILVCGALIFVPHQMVWLQLSLVMVGKLAVHCAYSTLCVHMTECFPTVVRAVALGSALTASRVGAIVAPFFKDLGRLTHPWVPTLVDMVLVIAALLLSLIVPETFRKNLPDTFKDTLRLREKGVVDVPTETELFDDEEDSENTA